MAIISKTVCSLLALICRVASTSIPLGLRASDTSSAGKAILYFLQNDPNGASIVAIDSSSAGAQPVITSTGGKGLAVVQPGSTQPVPNDTLNSAGAVEIKNNVLLTVNAGSNTVVMFNINNADPLHPTIVGKPVDSQGDFPASITYSPALKTACVLNGGKRNNVMCFSVDTTKGLTPVGSPRSLNLPITNPPTVRMNTVSHISFSPNNMYLLATNKGNSSSSGSTTIWPVQSGLVSQTGVKTTISDMNSPFGFAFQNSSRLFISDPTYGGSVVSVGSDLKITEVKHTDESSFLKASCWGAYSSSTGDFYAVAAGTPGFAAYSASSGAFVGPVNFDSSLGGAFDANTDPRNAKNVWFLAAVSSVAAVDVTTSAIVQNISIGSPVGSRQYWQGLGIYLTT